MYRQLDRCGGEWERERERERASVLLTQLLVTTAPQVALTELLSFAPAMVTTAPQVALIELLSVAFLYVLTDWHSVQAA